MQCIHVFRRIPLSVVRCGISVLVETETRDGAVITRLVTST
jgi:hypothetical protein